MYEVIVLVCLCLHMQGITWKSFIILYDHQSWLIPVASPWCIYSICVCALPSLCTAKGGICLSFCLYAGIELEWRKTQCIPREVCVDVGREFGAPTNIFYKPPCVSVYRCGGCCHSEDKQCRNISTGYLSKTVSTFSFLYPKYMGPLIWKILKQSI